MTTTSAPTLNKTAYGLAIASLISEMGIIVTGGAVRLTASGLGCSEWPKCTPESMVATPELGMHGAIEFGNRLLTFLLAGIALALVMVLWKQRKHYKTIIKLAVFLMLTIPLQAFIGGITVWSGLNPWVVACHFLVSAIMVSVATFMLVRVHAEYKRSQGLLPANAPIVDGETSGTTRFLAWSLLGFMALIVFLGTIVTGTGPHAGDPSTPRHDFDLELVARMHAAPVWLLVGASVVLAIQVYRMKTSVSQRRSVLMLIAAIVFQGAIGYLQHFNGVPIGLVAIHMLGTGLSVAAVSYASDKQLSKYRVRSAVDSHVEQKSELTHA